MRNADTVLNVHQKRGSKGLPLERVYKQLFNPEFYLRAYGKIYRNAGAMTKGTTDETVDGMKLQKVQDIIELLRNERYAWTPVRRTEIPKANGKTRPLGIPSWSDKLLQEVLRSLLGSYYEQKFSDSSHGFRPERGCHTALQQVRTWKGTVWFIEGDIKGCFDNIDHTVLLEIIRRDIHDGRIVKLIEGLLKAGYMEEWRKRDSVSGTPQGGIISPLLANIYLNELDRFVEGTLIPEYTRGERRKVNKEYDRIAGRMRRAKKGGDLDKANALTKQLRQTSSIDRFDPDYRRLRYVRYADDFLLGFVGTKEEAEVIRDRLAEFLGQELKLTLSMEKTLVTHATNDKANFLGYEVTVTKDNSFVSPTNGKRMTNGCIRFMMPKSVVQKYRSEYSRNGKVVHRTELLNDDEYTIVQRYQSVLRGIYNYYCMATNVGRPNRMGFIKLILETSLTKTLACKRKCRVSEIYRQHRKLMPGTPAFLRFETERPGKDPLVATFGGISFVKKSEGMGAIDFDHDVAWFKGFNPRSEAVQRLLAEKCELCGGDGPLEAHHVRKLADLNRPGRGPMPEWKKLMHSRKRKTLMVCEGCHDSIHSGRHDGISLRSSLESRVQ